MPNCVSDLADINQFLRAQYHPQANAKPTVGKLLRFTHKSDQHARITLSFSHNNKDTGIKDNKNKFWWNQLGINYIVI